MLCSFLCYFSFYVVVKVRVSSLFIKGNLTRHRQHASLNYSVQEIYISYCYSSLQRHNWSHFYHMNSCQEMIDYFYSFILHLLNLYMPTIRSSSNNFDKPWVTPEFRNLVKQRQRAYMSSQKSLYCKLRNKVQRLAASPRKQYYTKKIEQLHSADSLLGGKKTNSFYT